ncbi:phosphoribosylaminoimidazolesuccinocarboxamide synthase [Cetobacterium sp. 8H]|uniref:phosphoribosylaminoimidazolesuccinocarboxamide synthase n=1 Tax=Cetobacterium sp. 8H TaxID=2759681 RepID=UPI00163B7FCC|nr:phosphoribosylaminoimidazolesuccinocarboxamide synthase [Cetobacterium sp. 8H]MBC2850653.1 phosphoribosylaminoimidazolesuccinocarboxamide synthase [Cetobacterium sp. 8H]
MLLVDENKLYEGKAKKVYRTENPNEVIIYYKDDATAFNNLKKGQIHNKGILNAQITTIIFNYLKNNGVETHLIENLSDRAQLCKKVEIIPLEVIVRNTLAGSTAKLLKIEEGKILNSPIFEICYKKDELGDPMINDYHAIALDIATRKDLEEIYSQTKKINELLKSFFDQANIELVDFKIEFGKDVNGNIILADEISPDCCRLWDKETRKKLDKDRFRRDLGDVEEAYQEVLSRISRVG